MLTVMLLSNTFVTTVISAMRCSTPWAAGGLALVISFAFWSINYIAGELEQPFGDDPNDLPMAELQIAFNSSLCVLFDQQACHPPAFDYSKSSLGRTRERLSMALNKGDGFNPGKMRATFADLANRPATPVSEESSEHAIDTISVEAFTFEGRQQSPRGSPRASPRTSPRVSPTNEGGFATFSTWAGIHTVAEEEECGEGDGRELWHPDKAHQNASHSAQLKQFRHRPNEGSQERHETSVPVATDRGHQAQFYQTAPASFGRIGGGNGYEYPPQQPSASQSSTQQSFGKSPNSTQRSFGRGRTKKTPLFVVDL